MEMPNNCGLGTPALSREKRQQKDAAYVDDMRNRLDRAHERIEELTLRDQQKTERIKSLEAQVVALEKQTG